MWKFRKALEVYGGNYSTTVMSFPGKEALYQPICAGCREAEKFLRQQKGGCQV